MYMTIDIPKALTRFAAVAVLLAAPTMAPAAAKPENIAVAKDLAQLCYENMPDTRAIRAAFKEADYRYEGTDGSVHVYSHDGRRVIAGTNATNDPQKVCMVAVSKMTVDEAENMLLPFIEAAGARPARLDEKGVHKAWLGELNGKPAVFVVVERFQSRIMRGSGITIVVP